MRPVLSGIGQTYWGRAVDRFGHDPHSPTLSKVGECEMSRLGSKMPSACTVRGDVYGYPPDGALTRASACHTIDASPAVAF